MQNPSLNLSFISKNNGAAIANLHPASSSVKEDKLDLTAIFESDAKSSLEQFIICV